MAIPLSTWINIGYLIGAVVAVDFHVKYGISIWILPIETVSAVFESQTNFAQYTDTHQNISISFFLDDSDNITVCTTFHRWNPRWSERLLYDNEKSIKTQHWEWNCYWNDLYIKIYIYARHLWKPSSFIRHCKWLEILMLEPNAVDCRANEKQFFAFFVDISIYL